MIEYEREIAKLREKLKYLKESGAKQIARNDVDNGDEVSWKDTCVVLFST